MLARPLMGIVVGEHNPAAWEPANVPPNRHQVTGMEENERKSKVYKALQRRLIAAVSTPFAGRRACQGLVPEHGRFC